MEPAVLRHGSFGDVAHGVASAQAAIVRARVGGAGCRQRAATQTRSGAFVDTPAVRTIVDRHGVAWTFRVVTPARVERRVAKRRQARAAAPVVPERRVGTERRVAPQLRVRLPEDFAHGWLMLESATGERRRIAPVPQGWASLSETRLELLTRLGDASGLPDDVAVLGAEADAGEPRDGSMPTMGS